jgi:hypothetical protein
MKVITYEQEKSIISERFYSEINQILKMALPNYVLSFIKADENFKQSLEAWDGKSCLISLTMNHYRDTTAIRFLFSASESSKFKKYCIAEAGHAAWGCCLSKTIAVSYAPKQNELVTQVHESLHLFGVEECYEEYIQGFPPKNSCNNEQCVMRYGSNSIEVCESVLEQLRRNVG